MKIVTISSVPNMNEMRTSVHDTYQCALDHVRDECKKTIHAQDVVFPQSVLTNDALLFEIVQINKWIKWSIDDPAVIYRVTFFEKETSYHKDYAFKCDADTAMFLYEKGETALEEMYQ